MPKNKLFRKLYDLFSSNVVIRNIGGKKLKFLDTSRLQGDGNPYANPNWSNRNDDRFRRARKSMSGYSTDPNAYLHESRMELFNDYEGMDSDSIISSALDIYADETTSPNEEGDILRITSDNEEIKSILENLFYDILNVEHNLWSWTRNICKYGDFFLYLDIKDSLGVVNVIPMSSYEVTRVEGQDEKNPYQTFFIYDGERGQDIMENFQVAHFRILGDTNFLPYGRCLTSDSYVDMEFGRKRICDIKEGDKVYSYNIENKRYEITEVMKSVSSGKKEVYNVKTTNNELKGSKNHPFLIYENNQFIYKTISELKVNDLVVLQNIDKKNIDFKINKKLEGFNKNGWKNTINNIPDVADEDFVRFFGFMLGDGWITNNSVYFANGIYEDRNKYYGNILSKFSGRDIRFSNKEYENYNGIMNQTIVGSKMLAEVLHNNGFIDGCKNKRIPEWVFNLSDHLKFEFVRGLVDADGSINVDKWGGKRYNIEMCNYDLVKDLQQLLDSINIKTSHIKTRRENTIAEFNDGSYYRSNGSHYIYFYLDGKRKGQLKKYKQDNISNVVLEPIRKIESVGEYETYDIQVKDNNNFFANGFLVHNSLLEGGRLNYKALKLMEESMLLHRITRSPEKRAYYIDVGNLPPKEVDAFMEDIANETRKTPFIDPNTGNYNMKYNTENMLEDYYFPVRGDKNGTRVETMQGLQYDAIQDIDYLKEKLFAALKIPKAFLTYDENTGEKATLAMQDIRFARTIERIQKVIVSELTKIAVVHLYSQGFRDEDIVSFKVELNNPSIVFERERVDLLESKTRLARDLKDLKLLSWETIYKKLFKLSDKEIEAEKEKVIEDQKQYFRHEQITMEGNDPAKTGKSVGTNHDIAAMNIKNSRAKAGAFEPEEEMPDGGWPGSGRPPENRSYGTDKDAFGRDPIGRKAVQTQKTSNRKKEKEKSQGRDRKMRISPKQQESKDLLIKETFDTYQKKNSLKGTFLDENIVLKGKNK